MLVCVQSGCGGRTCVIGITAGHIQRGQQHEACRCEAGHHGDTSESRSARVVGFGSLQVHGIPINLLHRLAVFCLDHNDLLGEVKLTAWLTVKLFDSYFGNLYESSLFTKIKSRRSRRDIEFDEGGLLGRESLREKRGELRGLRDART